MIDALLRSLPLASYRPLRQAVLDYPRSHPIRLAATILLRRAAVAHRNQLAARMGEIRPLDAPELTFEAVDSMVMDAIYWFGVRGYEGTVARVWTSLCAQSSSVLEIGGNVGLFSVIGGRAAPGTYTVVEPVPQVAQTLRANLARNSLTKVEVLQAAVVPGAEQRDVMLNLPDENRSMPVGSHLVEDSEVSRRSGQPHLIVTGLPIGSLAAGRDLIKIDAEGIEAALLSDIRPMLLRTRPTLMIEVLPEATQLGKLLASLAVTAGYLIHVPPEYGSDKVATVDAASFTSETPRRLRAKDVVLSVRPLA